MNRQHHEDERSTQNTHVLMYKVQYFLFTIRICLVTWGGTLVTDTHSLFLITKHVCSSIMGEALGRRIISAVRIYTGVNGSNFLENGSRERSRQTLFDKGKNWGTRIARSRGQHQR